MSENFRSKAVTQGTQRAPNRALLRAVGFQDEDFKKAIVGVASAYSTITPWLLYCLIASALICSISLSASVLVSEALEIKIF